MTTTGAGTQTYERRVEPATSALDSFADDLTKELDQQNGEFPWWTGYSDWKTLTMIADYLIQSVEGAAAALIAASFAAKTHRESNFADSTAFTGAWRAVAQSGETDPNAFFAAIPRDAAARRPAPATVAQLRGDRFVRPPQPPVPRSADDGVPIYSGYLA